MAAEAIVTELIIDARPAEPGANQYTGQLRRIGGETDKTIGRVEKLGEAATVTGQRFEQSGRGISAADRATAAYLGRLDPTILAQNRLGGEMRQNESAMRSLDRQLMTGAVSLADHAQKSALLRGRLGELQVTTQQLAAGTISAERAMVTMATAAERSGTVVRAHGAALNDNTRLTTAASVSTGQMRQSVFQLGQQLNDIATSLASGGSPFQVIAQQAGQVQFALSQDGGPRAVIGAFASSIASMVTPSRAAAAGLVAVAAGAVAVLSHAAKLETQARTFNVAIDAMGTSALASGADFQKMVRDLQAMGVAADQARASLIDVIRVQGINPAAAGQFVATGANIAASLGGDPAQRAKDFATAAGAGIEKTLEYGIAVRAFTAAQADLLRKTGDVDVAVDRIVRAFDGRLKQTLSTTTRTLADVGAAFGSMWDALAVTGPAQAGIGALEHALRVITALAQGKPTYLNLPGFGLPGARMPLALNQAGAEQRDTNLAAGWNPNYDAAFATLPPALPATVTEQLARLKPALSDSLGQMISEAASQGIVLGIGSGLRSTERQAQLYAADLAKHGGVPSGWVARPGASMHERGEAGDLVDVKGQAIQPGSREDAWLAANQARFGITRPVTNPWEPWHVERVGARATSGLPDQERLGQIGREVALLNDQATAAKALGETGVWLKQYYDEFNAGGRTIEAHWSAQVKANAAIAQHRIELDKTAETQRITNDLALKTADAFGKDAVAGYRAAAMAQAELAVRAGDASSVQAKANELLRTGAAEALGASARALPGLVQQAEATQRLAAAAAQGTGAAHAAGVQNQVTAATHDVLTKAIATGDPALISRAEKLRALTEQQIKANDAAQQELAIRQRINERNDTIAVLQLQTGMQGQTPEVIAAATAHLQEQQRLLAQGVDLSSDIAKASLANVDALSRANIQLVAATRESQRWDDVIRSIASSIESTLTRALEDAFSGRRVQSWSETIKNVLPSIAAQIANATIIRPALGSVIGALGFGNVAQQFGSFGGGGATLTPNANGTFSLSNASSALSVGNNLFGGNSTTGMFGNLFGGGSSSSGGMFSGVSNFFGNLGGNLGFATPTVALSESSIASLGNLIGIEPSSLGFLGNAGTIPGSVFGGLTLGNAFTGIGGGFTAGSLTNSLLGGNQLFGSIGSGLGSIAGTLIGGPIGGIVGGALGGALGGPMGRKSAAFSSGGSIKL